MFEKMLEIASCCHPCTSSIVNHKCMMAQVEIWLRFKWRLQVKLCAPLMTGCVVGRGGTAVDGEGPWKEEETCQVPEAA